MNELENIMLLLNGFLINKNKSQELIDCLESYSLKRLDNNKDFMESQLYFEVMCQALRLGLNLTQKTCESLILSSMKGSKGASSSREACIELTHQLLTECLRSNNVESFSVISQCSANYMNEPLSDFLERILSFLLDSYDFETSHLWLKIPNDILGFIVISVGLTNAYVLCSLYEDSIETGKNTAMKLIDMAQDEVIEKIAIQLIEFGEYKMAYELIMAANSRGKMKNSNHIQEFVDSLPDSDVYSIILKKAMFNIKRDLNEL